MLASGIRSSWPQVVAPQPAVCMALGCLFLWGPGSLAFKMRRHLTQASSRACTPSGPHPLAEVAWTGLPCWPFEPRLRRSPASPGHGHQVLLQSLTLSRVASHMLPSSSTDG